MFALLNRPIVMSIIMLIMNAIIINELFSLSCANFLVAFPPSLSFSLLLFRLWLLSFQETSRNDLRQQLLPLDDLVEHFTSLKEKKKKN